MSSVPKPQKYLIYLTWFFAGLMFLGGFIGVVNDTLDLITLPISIIGTIVIVTIFFGAKQYLKRYPWHTEAGRITRLNFGMAFPLAGMIALIWLPQILQLIPEKREFRPEQEGETLIVISTFHRTEGVVDVDTHNEIRQALQGKINELELDNIRLELETTKIESDARERAEELGKRYKASMVIWGQDTGVRIEVNFLNLKDPDFDASAVTITETERTQIGQPDEYNRFIVHDLPNQIAFLTLFAIGQSQYLQTDLDQAILLTEESIQALPLNASSIDQERTAAYLRLGWFYSLAGRNSEAVEIYSHLIEINGETNELLNGLGINYRILGRYEDAIANFNKILLETDDEAVYSNRGIAYVNRGEYEKAFKDFEKALSINPEFASAYSNRGNLYLNLGDYEMGIADFEQALIYDPELSPAYGGLGLAHSFLSEYEQAVIDFSKAILISPNMGDAYYYRGIAYKKTDNYEDAITDLKKAITFVPDDPAAYFELGEIYYYLESYEQAIANYDLAIIYDDDSAVAFSNRGMAHVGMGDLSQALQDFNHAIDLDPVFATAYLNRAGAYTLLNQPAKAIADFQIYLELDPQSSQRKVIENTISKLEADLEN